MHVNQNQQPVEIPITDNPARQFFGFPSVARANEAQADAAENVDSKQELRIQLRAELRAHNLEKNERIEKKQAFPGRLASSQGSSS